jgi:hypothetical protein
MGGSFGTPLNCVELQLELQLPVIHLAPKRWVLDNSTV